MEKLISCILKVPENKKFLLEPDFFGIFLSEEQQTFPVNPDFRPLFRPLKLDISLLTLKT